MARKFCKLFFLVVLWYSTFVPRCLSVYRRRDVLDKGGKYSLGWTVDVEEKVVVFSVEVETRGWIGLGLSPHGGMPDSDIVIGWVDGKGNAFLTDRYATENGAPAVDTTSQDWVLLSGWENDTHTSLSFKRPFDTCDTQDRVIEDGTSRVIFAWNDADPEADVGPSYHDANRGVKSVLLLDKDPEQTPLPDNVLTLDIVVPKVHVPAEDTTYWCQCFRLPMVGRKYHVIKWEQIVQPGHERLVHHTIAYFCPPGTNESLVGLGEHCYGRRSSTGMGEHCNSQILAAFAVGGGPFTLPTDAGLPLGEKGAPNLIMLEMHYDNPELRNDYYDSSGVRIYYTTDLRRHDVGVLETGLENDGGPHMMVPPGAASFTSRFYCYPDCLKQKMAARSVDSITVIGGILHSHLAGVAIRARHFRRGVELPPIAEDETYDFNFQQTRYLHHPVEIRKGDYIVTECDYKTRKRPRVTIGGLPTYREMCLAFLIYYPRLDLTQCVSMPTYAATLRFASVETVREGYYGLVESPSDLAGRSSVWIMNNMNWTAGLVRQFQDHALRANHYFFCEDQHNQVPIGQWPRGEERAPIPMTRPFQPKTSACQVYASGEMTLPAMVPGTSSLKKQHLQRPTDARVLTN
ncbi:DBH-like monooxygenase protein 1 homolog isoform X2 [Branchiostoma floridae x Branchiostoma belcheri]